ncbi:hypothetical protein AAFF_G00354580 [Aldrovandia affinis]|uniref:Ig-like domain-containing protein n=1 Tax=Aldrovandia affinis TaxID=143900 RepID=A0AAD7WN73_9TELE|nr:hypothetical protein AAFF_G00354580 [Aldrovandia affinis]
MFKCHICPSDYCNVRWYVDRTLLHTDHLNKIKILPEGYHTLTIMKLARKDSGTISFEAGGKRTYASLHVKERHPTITKALEDCEATEGEKLVLSCKTSKSCHILWYKDGCLIWNSSKYWANRLNNEATLTIHEVNEKDTGLYECEAGPVSTKAQVTVKAVPVNFKQELKGQDAEEGGNVTLCCELSKPGALVEWKKGGIALKSGEKYQMKQKATISELFIRNVQPDDSGVYSCVCGVQKTKANLKVNALPVKFKQKLMKQEATEGGSVTLCCELSKPGALVEWQKGTEVLKSGEKFLIREYEKTAELCITNLQPQDTGLYSCVTGDQKTTAEVNVKAVPVTFKQELKTQDAVEGGSVTLHCELSKPGVLVEWKKAGMVLKCGEKYQMKQKATLSELLVRNVQPEDSGVYSCVCGVQKTKANLKVNALPAIFKQKLMKQEAAEGGNVTLRCELSKPGALVEWQKGTEVLKSGDKFLIRENEKTAELCITNLQPQDAGLYSCVTGDQKTTAEVNVKAALSVVFKKELVSQELKEGDDAVLSCELSSPNVPVTWKKDSLRISQGERYTIEQRGCTQILAIHKLRLEDNGEYICITRGKKTTAILTVKDGHAVEDDAPQIIEDPDGSYTPMADDSGQCMCSTASSTGNSRTVAKIEGEAHPHFIYKLQNVTLIEGQDAKFTCTTRCTPWPDIRYISPK